MTTSSLMSRCVAVALVLSPALGPAAAHAMSCDTILSMLDEGYSTRIVADAVRDARAPLTAETVACLQEKRVPGEVMKMAQIRQEAASEALGAPGREPAEVAAAESAPGEARLAAPRAEPTPAEETMRRDRMEKLAFLMDLVTRPGVVKGFNRAEFLLRIAELQLEECRYADRFGEAGAARSACDRAAVLGLEIVGNHAGYERMAEVLELLGAVEAQAAALGE